MHAPNPPIALPHRLRLWAILIATLVDLAALIALRLDVAPELIGEIGPLVDSALTAVLGLLVVGLGDAYLVERRRRTPGVPALPDDAVLEEARGWPEPPTRPDRPSRLPPAGLGLVLVVLAAVMSVATSGCGMTAVEAGRHGLAGTARVSAQLDRDLAAERVRVSEEIRARAAATREEHDEAMRPFDEALEITVDVRAAHLAAQEALDAVEHGETKDWRPLMTCVFSSVSRLIGLATRHVEVPAEAGAILQVLAELAEGKCPEPKRAEGGEQ